MHFSISFILISKGLELSQVISARGVFGTPISFMGFMSTSYDYHSNDYETSLLYLRIITSFCTFRSFLALADNFLYHWSYFRLFKIDIYLKT